MAKAGVCLRCKGPVTTGGNWHGKGRCNIPPIEQRKGLSTEGLPVIIQTGRTQLTEWQIKEAAKEHNRSRGIYWE